MLKACLVQALQERRIGNDALRRVDSGLKLDVRQMMDGGALHDGIPARADGVVEADSHEAVVVANRPAVGGCHAWERDAREVLPAGEQVFA